MSDRHKAWANTIKGLSILKAVAGSIPLIGSNLSNALDAVLKICEFVDEARKTEDSLTKLAEEAVEWVEDTVNMAEKVKGNQTSELQSNVRGMQRILEEVIEVLNKDANAERLAELQEKLSKTRARYTLSSVQRSEVMINELTDRADQDLLDSRLKPTGIASFDAKNSPRECMPDTRTAILREVEVWALASNDSLSVYWLTGMAGTGKTTIAKSICNRLKDLRVLGGSFFISRNVAGTCDPANVVCTLAHDLSRKSKTARTRLVESLKSQPSVHDRPTDELVYELIANPAQQDQLVLVIDALDECNMVEGREGGDLLPTLLSSLRGTRMKLLITSRNEKTIRDMFSQAPHASLKLHDVEASAVASDVRHFYEQSFKALVRERRLRISVPWPKPDVLAMLTKMTGHLFVYAATLMKFVGERRWNPITRLETWLETEKANGATQKGFFHLDALYTQILLDAATDSDGNVDPELYPRMQKLLGAIVLMRNPLSPKAIAHLIDVPDYDVEADLQELASVLIVPADDTEPVRILHPSFPEFMIDPARCSNDYLRIIPSSYHAFLAHRSISIMNNGSLRQDMCRLRTPWFRSEAGVSKPFQEPNLDEAVSANISEELRYACTYWMHHFIASEGHQLPDTPQQLELFSLKHPLHWIEVLSLMKQLPHVVDEVPEVIRILQDQQSDASSLFTDLLWLTRKSWDALVAHALQVYLAPFLILSGVLHDRIKKHKPLFAPIFKTWRLEGQWRTQPQIFTTNGRALSLLAVVVSHDRERIIALSAQQTLTLWDIHGGRLADVKLVDSVRLPEIGQCPRQRIVITFDDLRVIVTLLGINILVYDAKSLREVANWTCPAMVKDIALIPGTKMMLTTSNDGVIRQWNHETGRLTAGFKHPAEHITCSPDGRTLASIDISGKDIFLVDLPGKGSGEVAMRRLQHVSLPKPGSEEGHALCFSPDGSYLASAHGGGVVHLWSVPDRELVLTFSCVPCLPVSDLQFSSDGRYLLLVTRDQEAVIWDSTESRSMATTVQWPNTSLTDAKLIDQDVGGVAIVTTTTDGFVRLVQNTHLDQLIRVQPTIFSSPEVEAQADRSITAADAQHFTHIEDVRTQEAFVVSMTNGSNRDERPLKAFMLDETRVLQISSVGDGQKDTALARLTNWRTGEDYLKWEMDVAWNWSCAAVTSDGAYLAIACLPAHPVGKKVRRGTSKRHASTVSPELPGWNNEIPHQVIEIYRIKTGGIISTIDLPSRMDSIPISQLEFSVDGSILSAYDERQLSPTPTLEPAPAYSWQAGKDYLNLGVVYEDYKPSSLQFSGYKDGWLGVRNPLTPEVDLRLCWIPTELRWMQVSDLCRWKPNSASPVILPSHGAIVAITSANGVVTVIDFTEQLQDVFPPVIATGLVG